MTHYISIKLTMQEVEKLARKIWYGHNDQGFRRSGGEKFCDMPFAGINGWYTEFPFHQGEWTPVGEYEVYISYPKWDYDGQIMVRKPKHTHSSLGETSDGSSSALCGGSTMELEKAIFGNEGQCMADEITEATKAFDYSTLEEPQRIWLQEKTSAINTRMKRTAEGIIAIGQDLIEVKEGLAHGQFLDWLRSETDLNMRTAQRFMQVASRFGDESDNVSFLPVSVIYELAAPSTSDEVVQGVLQGQIPADVQSIKEAKERDIGYQPLSRKEFKKTISRIEQAKRDAGIAPIILPGTQPDEEKRRRKVLEQSRALVGKIVSVHQYLSEVCEDSLRVAGVVGTLVEMKDNLQASIHMIDAILQKYLRPSQLNWLT